MKRLILLLPMLIAACSTPADNPTRQVGDTVLIALHDGWNCYQGRCFQYYSASNQVQVVGHERADFPVLAEIDNDEVTPRNFLRLFNAAMSADDFSDI